VKQLRGLEQQISVTKVKAMIAINLVAPKAAAKHELFLDKPTIHREV
jgi:hypothetical protein